MDQSQLKKIFETKSRELFLVALAVTGRKEEAEDAVQDALLACLRSRARPVNEIAYVRVAVRNAAFRVTKKLRLLSGGSDQLAWVQVDGEQESSVFASEVNLGLASLAPDQRETVFMHIYIGMSFREIAELRGKSINTVASWYRRGVEQLREKFDDD